MRDLIEKYTGKLLRDRSAIPGRIGFAANDDRMVEGGAADLSRLAAGVLSRLSALGMVAAAEGAVLDFGYRLDVLLLEPALSSEHVVAVNAVSPEGRIIATGFEDYAGRLLAPARQERLRDVFRGETRFIAPFREGARVEGAAVVDLLRAVAWVVAPVRDGDGKVIAALGFAKNAHERFARILTAARPGETGEAFAFDASGTMLSDSSFPAALQAAGLLPAGEVSSIFRVQLRDPGGDLLQGYQPETDRGAQPPTRLAAAAIGSIGNSDPARMRGIILDPYRNYLGVEVVGAWRWLPEYGMGVAVEMSTGEGYAPLGYFHASFAVMLGFILLLWLGAYLSPDSALLEGGWGPIAL